MLHTAGADRRRAIANWQQQCQQMFEIARREEQGLVGGTRQLLLALSESSMVRPLNPRRATKFLQEQLQVYRLYSNLGVLKTNGDLLASALPLGRNNNFSADSFFRATVQTRG